jgi:hypothetical protein
MLTVKLRCPHQLAAFRNGQNELSFSRPILQRMEQVRWKARLFVVVVVGSAALTVALVAVALFGFK